MIKVQLAVPYSVEKMMGNILHIFLSYINIPFRLVEEQADLMVGMSSNADIFISKKFVENMEAGNYDHSFFFDKKPLILDENGRPDFLGTCFYILNCIQEYGAKKYDAIGRYPYAESFQNKFNCIERPLVNEYFERMWETIPLLNKVGRLPEEKSVAFVSHDIDTVYGSKFEDGYFVLKKRNLNGLVKILTNELRGKPGFFNFHEIIELCQAYEATSTFFWLVNSGASFLKKDGRTIKNSDYKINSTAIRQAMQFVSSHGFENGLHKSISTETYNQELKKLGQTSISNRNHYLRLRLPDHFDQLEESSIRVDYSLGFAEAPGFRNGFSLPFKPFHLKENRLYDICIVPLHLMDTTYRTYLKMPIEEIHGHAKNFLRANQQNTVFNILWHNSYFTNFKYQGFKGAFEGILKECQALGIKTVSTQDILNRLNY